MCQNKNDSSLKRKRTNGRNSYTGKISGFLGNEMNLCASHNRFERKDYETRKPSKIMKIEDNKNDLNISEDAAIEIRTQPKNPKIVKFVRIAKASKASKGLELQNSKGIRKSRYTKKLSLVEFTVKPAINKDSISGDVCVSVQEDIKIPAASVSKDVCVSVQEDIKTPAASISKDVCVSDPEDVQIPVRLSVGIDNKNLKTRGGGN